MFFRSFIWLLLATSLNTSLPLQAQTQAEAADAAVWNAARKMEPAELLDQIEQMDVWGWSVNGFKKVLRDFTVSCNEMATGVTAQGAPLTQGEYNKRIREVVDVLRTRAPSFNHERFDPTVNIFAMTRYLLGMKEGGKDSGVFADRVQGMALRALENVVKSNANILENYINAFPNDINFTQDLQVEVVLDAVSAFRGPLLEVFERPGLQAKFRKALLSKLGRDNSFEHRPHVIETVNQLVNRRSTVLEGSEQTWEGVQSYETTIAKALQRAINSLLKDPNARVSDRLVETYVSILRLDQKLGLGSLDALILLEKSLSERGSNWAAAPVKEILIRVQAAVGQSEEKEVKSVYQEAFTPGPMGPCTKEKANFFARAFGGLTTLLGGK